MTNINLDRWEKFGVGTASLDGSGNLNLDLSAESGECRITNKFNYDGRPDITEDTFMIGFDLESISDPGGLSNRLSEIMKLNDNYEVGVFNEGSGIFLFVNDGSSDVYTASLVGTDAELRCPRDDYQFSDDLSGTGQNVGSITDGKYPGRYKDNGTDGTVAIVSNNFRYTVDPGNPTARGLFNTIALSGEFEVSVTLNMVTYLANNTVSQSGNFRVHRADTEAFLGQISLNKINAATNSQWMQEVENSLGVTTLTSSYASDTIVFNIRRDENDLIQFGVAGVYTSSRQFTYAGDVLISTQGNSRWGAGNLVTDFSPISIVTEQFNKRLFFNIDSTLTAAFDIDTIDQVDLILSSVDSTTYKMVCPRFYFEAPEGVRYSTTSSLII